mmetsp:Transcript_19175/g.43617  ORF Transcript_19175/g.43617 Transcript_19175/m.43617 type:complete len:448 (-) Transcript_19175:148-1491(-)
MSMHTPQEWHHHAGSNMANAQHTHRKAHRQNQDSHQAHVETVADNIDAYQELHGSLKQKVQTSYRLIDTLQRRADSLQNSIKHTQHTLAQLEAAHRAKDPKIQLCLWRLEQREKRPLREQVRDNTELTLESEKATLVETQKKLSDGMKRTKAMITDLEQKLAEVRHDLDHKQQALGVDETCLRTTQRSYHTVVERTRPHSSPGTRMSSSQRARQPAAFQESTRNELQRQQDAVRLNQSSASKEEQGKGLREDMKVLIGRCQKAADDATSRSERALQERINEAQQMRRRLEGEIRETNGKIDHTKHTISETRQQIKNLEEPIDLTTTCSSYRKQRATREHITDPVSTRIQEHQMTVLRAQQDLIGHHQQEKSNLQDLNERKERLKDDLRDKTSALHIDLNCLTHEAMHHNGKPQSYLSKNKLSRATMLDPTFVPSPAANIPLIPHTAR